MKIETEILKDKNTVIFKNVEDYDLAQTFDCGQCFRWREKSEGFEGFAGEYLCKVRLEDGRMAVESLDGRDLQAMGDYMYHYLALDMDYKAMKEKFSRDEIMRRAIDFAPGIRVLNQPFFETLITFIISRNNNIPRIKKIVNALSERYGEKKGEFYAFPTAEQLKNVTVEEYARLRMGFRAKYVFDRVQKVLSGEIDRDKIKDMDYVAAQKYLMQIKGVGPKVADCVLLFSCEKYESFPKDVWINRALAQLFPQGLPRCIAGLEGIAQQYIFHYARFHLEK